MLNSKSYLCLDFGAGSLKAAEFELNEAGTLRLKQYGVRPLGLEGSQETARENVLRKAMTELIAERQFGARKSNVCAPGFHVFSKFVKLPPVDSSKVTQIIQYEAQQNVPFPLEEVVWDYQILGTTATGEMEVLLVAIKADLVEGLFKTAEATGLKIQLVDVSPAALCNAFRFNYGDLDGCTMLLDIGAKTSNVLFFEKGKVYSRGINIGANSITQEFAAEAKLRFPEAEKIKIAEGFVSLGGAYEEPDSAHQAAISKIARQVMTRLHIQVNQTIQFYRGQQGGSAPQRLFLAGGASIMPYTAQFFAEKLSVQVEYFNPFRNIEIDPAVNLEELAKVAHSFGEVVGLGLRNLAQCPVELNLVPKSIRKRQQMDQKKPYFIATAVSLILFVFAYGWFYDRVANVKSEKLATMTQEVEPLQRNEDLLKIEEENIKKTRAELDNFAGFLKQRFVWSDTLTEIRRVLLTTEQNLTRPGVQVGVWLDSLGQYAPGAAPVGPASAAAEEEAPDDSNKIYRMDPALMARYGLTPGGMAKRNTDSEGAAAPAATGSKPSTNGLDVITVKFKAVNLNKGNDRSANGRLAFEVETNLQASVFFDPAGTKLSGELEQVDDGSKTFTFGMNLKLKQPIKN